MATGNMACQLGPDIEAVAIGMLVASQSIPGGASATTSSLTPFHCNQIEYEYTFQVTQSANAAFVPNATLQGPLLRSSRFRLNKAFAVLPTDHGHTQLAVELITSLQINDGSRSRL